MFGKITIGLMLILIVSLMSSYSSWAELNIERLSKTEIKHVQDILQKLLPLIQERQKKENLATLAFSELYAPLSKDDQNFLKQFQGLDAKVLGVKIPFREIATGKEDLVVIRDQQIRSKDPKTGEFKKKWLTPQFLPKNVYEHYKAIMKTLKKDLGKQLYVDSGYRSSAYQLYLLVFYLQNHDYSIHETVKFVALPGYSEHGSPSHQAIDFINENGIDGENNPAEFEALEEYEWLLKNAKKFDFVLSYPKNAPNAITFEPWHWRFEPNPKKN